MAGVSIKYVNSGSTRAPQNNWFFGMNYDITRGLVNSRRKRQTTKLQMKLLVQLMEKPGFVCFKDQIVNKLKKLKKEYRDAKKDILGCRPANQLSGAPESRHPPSPLSPGKLTTVTRGRQDPLVWRVTGVPHFHHLVEYKKVELSALQCLSVNLCGILKSWFHALATFSSGSKSSVLDPASA
ncbi:hypothetical protein CRENBAI_014254 [Crenichthys baileyi]|uniref:Uncharacterized protein n=1 Tax=Crenichthys baileyi TaxID=28760 RepID=A0AAV9R8C5_9TELE